MNRSLERQLRRHFGQLNDTDDPRADLVRLFGLFRAFVRENPVLTQVMYSRPFGDFNPGPEDAAATSSVRRFITGHVKRCIDAGVLAGDETDIAHVLLGLAQGLAAQETAGWLATSQASADRRWSLAFQAALDGLAP